MQNKIYSVSEINGHIKEIFDNTTLFSNILVCGEISNFKRYPSGHLYFTLKDNESCLKCVMFRSYADKMRFRPDNGQKVLAVGKISAYPRDGVYQLYSSSLTPFGQGELSLAFEQIKSKLCSEGLFDPVHKKQLPQYPDTIAVITSPAGAAVHDIIRILGCRWPLSEIIVIPVHVQGIGAAEEIAQAIEYVNRHALADLIITGRGGGSLEDLWAFNEEVCARAIFCSSIPIISAVGHEPDFTIADYVADKRASTPSNAAEIAVKDCQEMLQYLNTISSRLLSAQLYQLQYKHRRLDNIKTSGVLKSSESFINEYRMRIDSLCDRLHRSEDRTIQLSRIKLGELSATLNAISPLNVLSRGYALLEGEHNNLITNIRMVNNGEKIKIRLTDGSFMATVNSIIQE